MPFRAIVTGASGFIGSHLIELLISQKWDVTCLLRTTSRTDFLEKFPVKIIQGNTENQDILERAVQGQQYIFHCAARIMSAPSEVYEKSNHKLTRDLVYSCLRTNPDIKRFIYISSIAAAGPSSEGKHKDEIQMSCPSSEYGRTKLKGERAVQEVWDKIPATIIRPPNVYGARQSQTELLVKLIQKRIVPLLKSDRKSTSLIYIKDLVRGILQAAESSNTEGQIYYLTDGQSYSWKQVILTIKMYVLKDKLFLPLPEEVIGFFAWLADTLKSTGIIKPLFGRRAWQAMVSTQWLFSSSKAAKDFGFKPRYDLNSGIRDMLADRLEKIRKL
jgi:dihydroflavonol-4-reductase